MPCVTRTSSFEWNNAFPADVLSFENRENVSRFRGFTLKGPLWAGASIYTSLHFSFPIEMSISLFCHHYFAKSVLFLHWLHVMCVGVMPCSTFQFLSLTHFPPLPSFLQVHVNMSVGCHTLWTQALPLDFDHFLSLSQDFLLNFPSRVARPVTVLVTVQRWHPKTQKKRMS